MIRYIKPYISHIILTGLLFLMTVLPFITPGGIALLDYVMTPHALIDFWGPVNFMLLNISSRVFGPEFTSKVYFLLILIAGAYLGVLFGRQIAKKWFPQQKQILEVFGGVFLIINPFAYERMMVQPSIYFGIILLGYLIYMLFFSEMSLMKRYLLAGLFAGVAFNIFPHASYMIVLIFGLSLVLFTRSWKVFFLHICSILIILLLNINWLIAPLFGVANSASTISTFSNANVEAFRTQSLAPLDIFSTNLLLYGFWGERYGNHYVQVDILSSLWYIAGFAILFLSFLGYWILWKRGEKKLVWMAGITAMISLILGIGIASPLTVSIMEWGYRYLPLFTGYREPQKWIGLLMIVEMVGFILGIGTIVLKIQKDRVVLGSVLVTVTLLLYIWSPGPIPSYHGQLRTTTYPTAFETLRTELLGENSSGKILALPWHSYIGCSWMGRSTIANPIGGILAPLPVIVSDNIEVGSILYTNSLGARSQAIEAFIGDHHFSLLMSYDIQSILFMKSCATSDQYTWLEQIPECEKSQDNAIYTLYRCKL